MLRAGTSCRLSVLQVLRTDTRSYQREFHHLTTRLCSGNKVVPLQVLSLPVRIKVKSSLVSSPSYLPYIASNYVILTSDVPSDLFQLRDILWREYRAVRSMLLRSGVVTVNAPLLRVLSSNSDRGFHTCVSCSQGGGRDGDKNEDDKKDKKNDMQLFVKSMTYFTLALILALILYPDDPAPSRVGLLSSIFYFTS